VEKKWRALATDPRVIDGALVALCLFLTALAVKTPWSHLPRPVIAVAGAAGSAGLWWRRDRPGPAMAGGAVAFILSGNPGPVLIGLVSGGLHSRPRDAWKFALAGLVGFAGWSWVDEGRLRLEDLLTSALAAAALAGLGAYAATRRELQESLRERAEQAEAERALRDERARSAERTRIAREMHDVLAHKISLIAVHAGAIELGAADSRPAGALIRTTAREALAELRTVLGVLRQEPAPFADLPALVASAVNAGQPVELRDEAGPLPGDLARIVYRVAQEGLTNARKHAPGARVTVAVDRTGDPVTVTIHNGGGTAAALDLPGAGAGLIGLAERLRLAGGALESGPDGPGWQLRAVIPSRGGDVQ
jgi:signal transduction histidine kinase